MFVEVYACPSPLFTSAYQLYLGMMKVQRREGAGDDAKKASSGRDKKGGAKSSKAANETQNERREDGREEEARTTFLSKLKTMWCRQVDAGTDDEEVEPVSTSDVCKQFKRTLCHKDVMVHFVGVW